MKKNASRKTGKNWSVYIVRCADSTLYTGISNDIKRRVEMHNSGKGAKYIVPSRRPVRPVYVEEGYDVGGALKRERVIKRAGKKAREKLVKNAKKNGKQDNPRLKAGIFMVLN